jgi:hypothetical protein
MVRGQKEFPAHAEPVCMLKSPLPASVDHTVIGEVRGGKKTYGSMEEVLTVMGKEARSIGADAVVSLKTRRDIGAWAWSRPVGNGDGVKLASKSDFDCLKSGGEFR